MIGQVVKETVLVNSAEVEKEKVAGGVKLNFSADVKAKIAKIATNESNIATNTTDIATNTANIATNTADIATNTAAIASINTTIAGAKRTRKTIQLPVANWTLNSTTNKYECEIQDADVTANHLVSVTMDLDNQAKLTDGYVESFAGSYKFYTSVQPTEAITATVIFELTEEVVQAGA